MCSSEHKAWGCETHSTNQYKHTGKLNTPGNRHYARATELDETKMSSVTRNQKNANGSHVRILKSAPNLQTLNFTKGDNNKGNDCDSL